MSVVTGIVLTVSCGEKHEALDLIQAWVKEKGFGPLVDVASESGGSKHPQIFIYTAGYNYFPNEEFVTFFLEIAWKYPDEVVLVLQPEDGATEVYRPQF